MAEIHIDVSEDHGIEGEIRVEVNNYQLSDLTLNIGDLQITVNDRQAEKLYQKLHEWFGPAPDEENNG